MTPLPSRGCKPKLESMGEKLSDEYQAKRHAWPALAEPGLAPGATLGGPMKPKEAHRAATGIDAHGHPPVRRAPNPGSADRKAGRTDAVSVRSLLDVMADLDQFGGASLELVAWDLYMEESAGSAAWSRAVADGILERSGTDDVSGEETWRLTMARRRACKGSDDVSA